MAGLFLCVAALLVCTCLASETSWQLSRLNDDTSWYLTCAGTRLMVDPWLIRKPVGFPNYFILTVPFVDVPTMPAPVVTPEEVAAKSDAVLTALTFPDHSNPDTLKVLADKIPMFGPPNVSIEGVTVTALPPCESGGAHDLPNGLTVCHHASAKEGDIYKQGMLWIRGPCGSLVYAPHGTTLPPDLAQRISTKAAGQTLTVMSSTILEAIVVPSLWVKPGPKVAVSLVEQLQPDFFYSTHNLGDIDDSGISWDAIVRWLPSQEKQRDMIGTSRYMGSHINVSAWPNSDPVGTPLVPPGIGTRGIPFSGAKPDLFALEIILIGLILVAIGATIWLCTNSASAHKDIICGFYVAILIVPIIELIISALVATSGPGGESLMRFIVTAAPGVVVYGPIAALIIVISTTGIYLGQVVYATCIFQKLQGRISGWYASIIQLNIVAMALVTWRFVLTFSLVKKSTGGMSIHTAPSPATIIVIFTLIAFPLHSMCNITRVIFDMFGKDWAVRTMPLGYMSQAWLLVPAILGTLTFHTIFMILAVTDYVQHGIGATYWAYCACRQIDPARTKALLLGVIFHMVSLVPYIILDMAFPKATAGPAFWFVIIWMEVSMFISQASWTKAAELTPQNAGFTPLHLSLAATPKIVGMP